jgi:flagellar biosynthesis anti-sigma factor FlgM
MKINTSAVHETPADLSTERPVPLPIHGGKQPSHAAKTPVSHSRPAQLSSPGSSGRTVNSSRIAEIRQKIADGSYQIDAARIADSLLNAAREFFIRRRS